VQAQKLVEGGTVLPDLVLIWTGRLDIKVVKVEKFQILPWHQIITVQFTASHFTKILHVSITIT
jgi:hypothetical protein